MPPRRAILTALPWTAPAILLAANAPAYATSPNPVPDCAPVGCKRPGVGKHTKDYYVRTRHRDAAVILSVVINDQTAVRGDHGWEVLGAADSRRHRPVVIKYTLPDGRGGHTIHTWTGEVAFDVCEDRK